MLQNRKTAWLITVAFMVAGLLLGSFMSFRSMREEAIVVFRQEVEPALHEQMQMVYNMLTIYSFNTMATQVLADSIGNYIEQVQAGIQNVSPDLPLNVWLLTQHSESIYRQSTELNLSDTDARFIQNFHIDIQELQMVIAKSSYNIVAQDFNEASQRGLGFLSVLWGAFANRQLPIF